MVVHKDIYNQWPVTGTPLPPGSMLVRSGTLKGDPTSNDDDKSSAQALGPKSEFSAKTDSADNIFMDDVSTTHPSFPFDLF